MGVYLAAPRLREVDTELLVRAALGGGGGGAGEEEDGDDDGGGRVGSNGDSGRDASKESQKRLFVPIVGDGPQEMCLVHLGEYFVPFESISGERKMSLSFYLLSRLPLKNLSLSFPFFSSFSPFFPRFARRTHDRAPLWHPGALERLRRRQAAGGR